ncbi:hypothetical protein CAPTEDRAFT_205307 [Capitella teleta]|uniref:HECT domain-containing protein n=1 Tax=Capitella teleta TaxID=283909 RepID=R7TUR2_CAPTE|nr:hypothetical protein CAPTEDRAFT_205307 [Capitella teleta]|eukprot:ELT94755.1 hypothetical protein CAPTEDRAFT_205307 [Capitella teleta]
MDKPIFCSIYSVDNTRSLQDWFIREFRRRVGSHERRKQLRIESDWESIKPTNKFFTEICQKSTYTMFLYDGTEINDKSFLYLEHYHSIAAALGVKGKTQFVPIGLCSEANLSPYESLLGHYKPIRFESVSDNENNEKSWKRLLSELFPDYQHDTQINVTSPQNQRLLRERSEDVLMKGVLRSFWTMFKNTLDLNTDTIKDHLFQDDIISVAFNEKLASITLRREKTEALLSLLLERPADQIQRFFDLLKQDYHFLYIRVVKEIAIARANAAQTSVAQNSHKSASSSVFGAENQLDLSLGFSTPSTDSSDETLRKTDEIPPVSDVTQQLSQVFVSGDNTRVPQSRGQTGATTPNLILSLDKADGSNATSAPGAPVAGANRELASDMSNICDDPTLNLQSGMMSIQEDPSTRSKFHMKVKRGNVLKELMWIFRKNTMLNILQCDVQAEFTGEAIGSGVLLDMLSAFWEEFFQHYSEGEDEKVLLVHTDNNQENLKCAGSILRFGFEYCPKKEPLHFFPHQLCLASIINVIHHNSISENMADKEAIWTASLYAYLGAISGEKIRAVYENPNSASEDDWEEINDMLDDLFQKKYTVNADNIRDKLSHLADVHLLQKSKTSLDLMGLVNWKKWYPQHFGNIDKIVEFSKRFHPTPVDVVNALKEDMATNPIEEEALKNLRKFTRGLTQVDLKKFLRFVTGSALKPKTILVDFSRDEHQPINARTCSSLLYIPLGLKYNDFRNKFKEIISSEMYQDMTYALSH